MKKVIEIKGMHCEHCRTTAENALNAIPGVKAKVDLKKSQAVVSVTGDIPDEAFIKALKEFGYEAVSVTQKKGLFE